MSLADEINELFEDELDDELARVIEAMAQGRYVLQERVTGGMAYSKIAKAWRKEAMNLLSLVTQLRLSTNAIAKTPGYEDGRGGKRRPGVMELDAGVKQLAKAIGLINKGVQKLGETTFLEDEQ